MHIRPSQVHAFDAESRHEALLLMFLPEAVADSSMLELVTLCMTGVLRPKPADFELLASLLTGYESMQTRHADINPNRLGPYLLGALLTAIGDLLTPAGETGAFIGKGPAGLVHALERLVEKHHATHMVCP